MKEHSQRLAKTGLCPESRRRHFYKALVNIEVFSLLLRDADSASVYPDPTPQ
jgi:hypothetical protein